MVLEAAEVLAERFGRRTLLSQEVTRDPESDESELFAYANVDLPIKDALIRLRLFDERWFLDQQDRIRGLFNVDVCLP